jgi:DDE_Tnp_1-associated
LAQGDGDRLNGIPSRDTFRQVFMLLDPDALEACFTQ